MFLLLIPSSKRTIIKMFYKGIHSGLLTVIISLLYGSIQLIAQNNTYPPTNLWVDPLTSIAYWDEPVIPPISLYEDFEGGELPEGWRTWSHGNSEWFITQDGSSTNFEIPSHSWYAVCNDNAVGFNNNGCCDYFCLPILDLRTFNNYILTFQSFFTSMGGQDAFIEYSTNGADFMVLEQISHHNDWIQDTIDLSSICGSNAGAYTWMAFRTDDNGNHASGWAVDDIEVNLANDEVQMENGVLSYHVFLDGEYAGVSHTTSYNLGYLDFGKEYTAGVCAYYFLQLSDTITYSFTSEYLLPVRNLRSEGGCAVWAPPFYYPGKNQKKNKDSGHTDHINGSFSNLSETAPYTQDSTKENIADSIPANLLYYIIYRYGDSVATVETPDNIYCEWDPWYPGIYEYMVSAVYDLSPYGYSGSSESMKAGPVYCQVSFGDTLPFQEDWSSGSFETNQWDHSSCDNWVINLQEGNPSPCAQFSGIAPLIYYRCPLMSYWFKGTDYPDGDIWLDFDIKLVDNSSSGSEKLTVAVWQNGYWHDIKIFNNNGSFNWESVHTRVSNFTIGKDFSIAFIAEGDSSEKIESWHIDNVYIYWICSSVTNVEAELYDENDLYIKVSWIPPDSILCNWFSYNDGSYENAFASTEGGLGLGQLFIMDDFPSIGYPLTITKLRYHNSSYGNYTAEEKVYILSGDGSSILSGPYNITNGPAADWTEVDINNVTIEEGNFMIATVNTYAGGPFVGADDSYYNGTLSFGCIGDWTELGELGAYYYVGSHEAYIEIYSDGKKTSHCLSYNDISQHLIMNHSLCLNSGSSRELKGCHIYKSINGGEFQLLNTNPVQENYYLDYCIQHGYNEYCYFVMPVYDHCQSTHSDTVCEWTFPGEICESNEKSEYKIYPNPAKHILIIESIEHIISLQVYSSKSQLAQEIYDIYCKEYILDLRDYKEGLYFVQIRTKDEAVIKKFIVIK